MRNQEDIIGALRWSEDQEVFKVLSSIRYPNYGIYLMMTDIERSRRVIYMSLEQLKQPIFDNP